MMTTVCHFDYGQDYICQKIMTPQDCVAEAEAVFAREKTPVFIGFSDQHIRYMFNGVWNVRGEKKVSKWWWECAASTATTNMRETNPTGAKQMNKTINKKFSQFITKTEPANGGDHTEYTFPNGHGASVICGGTYAYGLELAVLDGEGVLDYSTPITHDVLGHLSDEDLETTLEAISNLK